MKVKLPAILIIASLVAVGGLGLWRLSAQVADVGVTDVPDDLPEYPPGVTPRQLAGQDFPPIAPLTPTPDLRRTLTADDATQYLLDIPNVGPVVQAVLDGDVDALLSLIAWRVKPCALHRDGDRCPPGTPTGTLLPMANVGEVVQFWVTEARLRPALEQLLSGGPLRLTVASQTDELPWDMQPAGPVFWLGFEGDPRPIDADLWHGPDATGLFLIVDSGAKRPIVDIVRLTQDWPADRHASEFTRGFTGHTIITFPPERLAR